MAFIQKMKIYRIFDLIVSLTWEVTHQPYVNGVISVKSRRGVNSIPELELMVNSGIGIDYLKNGIVIELELRKFELKFPTKN